MTKKLYPLLLTILILNTACNNNQQAESKTLPQIKTETPQGQYIQNLTALYYNHFIPGGTPNTSASLIQKDIPDFKTRNKGILDAQITDSTNLSHIKQLIDSLHPSMDSQPIADIRITFKINRQDGTTDTLNLGGQYANQIYLNQTHQQPNNQLVFILKNNIGYYPWFVGPHLTHMSELQDTTFPKAPFISSAYYKVYQENLSQP